VADLEAEVPEEIQHELDGTEHRRGRLVDGEEQQVDVAERRQHAAAVATGGRHAEATERRLAGRVRRLLRQCVGVQRDDQSVGQRRQQARGFQP
jgi:hypothetical protein